jgi:hypothetical protein
MPTAEERIIAVEVRIWNPMLGERMGAAWDAVVDELWDNEWHPWNDVLATAMEAGEILRVSAVNLVSQAVKLGLLEKSGEYKWTKGKKLAVDSRMVRIARGARKKRPDLFYNV